MSKTGSWGDKIIITLHSDGRRRHKTWCENYREGNYCTLLQGRCVGSAHCEHYKNRNEGGSDVLYRVARTVEQEGKTVVAPPRRGFTLCERYRQASYGDKLLGKTVLVKNTPHTFRICEVTWEDIGFFKVRYDGREHKYAKQVAYRNQGVYLYIGTEVALEGGEEI